MVEALRGLRDHFRCSICQDVFHNPATVSPCNHHFCFECISNWQSQSGESPATCPEVIFLAMTQA
ncbi:zinc finger, C3HC4 type [Ostertagia ostertagi]